MDCRGDVLGCQLDVEDEVGGGEHKDDCRNSKQEHVSPRLEQRPFGAARGSEKVKFEGHSEMKSTRAHRSILIETQYMAKNIPKCRARLMIRRA